MVKLINGLNLTILLKCSTLFDGDDISGIVATMLNI